MAGACRLRLTPPALNHGGDAAWQQEKGFKTLALLPGRVAFREGREGGGLHVSRPCNFSSMRRDVHLQMFGFGLERRQNAFREYGRDIASRIEVVSALSRPENCSVATPAQGEVRGEDDGIAAADPNALMAKEQVHYDSEVHSEVWQGTSRETGKYVYELEVATQAVQLACQLSIRVQERLRMQEEVADTKSDKSPVTVADWGVQAVVSWVLSGAFPGEELRMVAEEDTEALKGSGGIEHLQRVVAAVNDCLAEASLVGLSPPTNSLGAVDVLKAIQRGSSPGGGKGRHWVLDPVDGTLGFIRGDQYAIALAMIDDGEVVLGVLGCPNFPMRTHWLKHPHRYHRVAAKLFPPEPGQWYRGCVMKARKGGGGAWMEPLVHDDNKIGTEAAVAAAPQRIKVSMVDDPAAATFCEPVEKANSRQELTANLALGIGMRREPLRVYSMAKYAAIARGDAEIFMKFARAGYREKIWDHAAGVIIVEEAGGVVTDAGGQPLDFSKGRYLEGLDRGIIATCSPRLHSHLLSAVDASRSSSTL